MKANAPEKLYLLPDDINPNGLSICWYETPYRTGAIEYTRTDVFIEKAKMWMLTHTYMFQSMEEVDLYIEMFIKEMKGE